MDRKFHSNLKKDIVDYIEFREAISRNTKNTIMHLVNLDKYIAENWSDETELTKDVVLGWLVRRPSESGASVNDRASFIRVFASYLKGIGRNAYVIPTEFCARRIRYTPYLFSDEKLYELFHAVDADTSIDQFAGCILSTLLRLIYTCGLRPSEGLRILRDHINLTTGEIHLVKTKMNKERFVVVSDDMLRLLNKFISIRDLVFPESEYLFPAPDGEPYPTHWLSDKFRKYFRSLYPETPLSEMPCARVYDLRHRFASQCLINWLNEGVDLNARLPYLSTFMGHGSMNETEYYIHILPENLVTADTISFAAMESIVPEAYYED